MPTQQPKATTRRRRDPDVALAPATPYDAAGSPVAGLYPPASAEDRKRLLQFIETAPFGFGSWRYFKALYKRVEAAALADPAGVDAEILGALLGRIDAAPLNLNAGGDAGRVAFDKLGYVAAVAAAPAGRLLAVGMSNTYGYKQRVGRYDLTKTTDPLKPRADGHADAADFYRWADFGQGRLLTVTKAGYAWAVSGDYRTRTLTGYDLSGEKHPEKRGSHSTSESLLAHDVALGAPTAVLLLAPAGRRGAPGTPHLVPLDLSDPDRPKDRGELEVANATNVALSDDGRTAVVAVSGTPLSFKGLPKPGGLRIVDVSDVARPRLVGAADRNGVSALLVSGGLAYVGTEYKNKKEPASLHVYDVSQPARPLHVATLALPQERAAPHRFTLDPRRNLLVVQLQGYNGVVLIDVASPAAPRLLGSLAGFEANSVALRGDHLYAQGSSETAVLDVADPARPFRMGVPPSQGTMGYLKRRVRRLLRDLSVKAPARYAEVAAAFLAAAGKGKGAVERGAQWATMDVLFGGGDRWVQQSHGRGTYSLRKGAPERRIRLRTREERAPAAWDADPAAAAGLLSTGALPAEVYELAARVLRTTKTAAPEKIGDKTLARFLESGSPLLARLATERVAGAVAAGKTVAPALAADAFLLANAARRRALTAALSSYAAAQGDNWAGKFAAQLASRMQAQGVQEAPRLSRRHGAALSLFATVPALAGPGATALLSLAGPALASGRPELVAAVAGALEKVEPDSVLFHLRSLGDRPAEVLEPAWSALCRAVAGRPVAQSTAWQGVQDTSEAVRRGMWRVLAASATPAATLAALWNQVFDAAVTDNPLVRTAMSSPDALATLARSGITPEQVAARLSERPFLVGLLTPETFGTVTRDAPATVTLSLVAAAPDGLWSRLRPALLANLRAKHRLAELWKALPAVLEADAEDRLAARLLADAEVADTFLLIEDADAALSIRDAAFAPLLGRYVDDRVRGWARDSELLLTAASHALPEVREPALGRILVVGMSLPFALRLLESQVPDAVRVGERFFEGRRPEDAFPFALALCDSPVAAVRAYGRRYVSARWDTLPREELYRALFENPAPEMQAFVATLLNDEPAPPEESARFDGEVLRTRNRARRAKEAVKARQEKAEVPTVDVDTLLALARGADGTPRDAEWALTQLARLALSGKQIDGFAIVEG